MTARARRPPKLIEAWKAKVGHRLEHVWHEDRGFRAAEIRNRAILAARGDYCIFLDGDCIVRPDFVATHRRLAEPGWFVTGNRILLSRAADRQGAAREARRRKPGVSARWIARALARRRQSAVGAAAAAARAAAQAAAAGLAAARAPAISRSGAPISIASTASTPTTAAGARRIPISSCGCCMPACAARTAYSPPALSICGTPRPTARGWRRTSASSPTSSPAIACARNAGCRRCEAAAATATRGGLTDGRRFRSQALSTARGCARIADGLAVAVAVSLPWSTSATSILVVLWLLALIPTLDWANVRRELLTPAGGLPVLLFAARRARHAVGRCDACSSAGRASIRFSSCW